MNAGEPSEAELEAAILARLLDPDAEPLTYPEPARRRHGALTITSTTTAELVQFVVDDQGLPLGTLAVPMVPGPVGGWVRAEGEA